MREKMTEDRKGVSLVHLAIGAGVIAVAAVGVATLVPRRRWTEAGDAIKGALEWPLIAGAGVWLASLLQDSPRAPQFNDMRPYDDF
jgi:hypothetical protein